MALYVIIIANGHCSSGTSATANFGNITCYFVIHPVWWFSFGLTSPIICCLSVPSEHRLANWSHLVPAPLLTIVWPGQSIVKWEGGVSFLSNSSRPSVCHNVRQRAMSKYGYALLSVVHWPEADLFSILSPTHITKDWQLQCMLIVFSTPLILPLLITVFHSKMLMCRVFIIECLPSWCISDLISF